mmetsp:Transcript_6453/g.12530  ORF Transcript_6453/g.12530 Transcript_6453/m.12530 type:complete len:261 (-) Transcript_6453:146-928(-)
MRTPEQSHASLQRELATLEEKYTWDDAPAAVKRRMRTIKNRLSAKRSREQAREYVEKLEGSVKVLEDESDSLARRLAIVEAENKILKQVDSRRLSHAAARDQDDAMREASTTPTMIEEEGQDEPAVPPKPSLQLDALLLLFQTVAASQEASQPSGPTPPPAGGPRPTSSAHAHGYSNVTSRLLRLRRTLKLLTKQRILGSTCPDSQSPAFNPEARDKVRRARVMRGLQVTRSLLLRQRSATPRAPRPSDTSDGVEHRKDC